MSIPERIRIGAAELRDAYNGNLGRALIASVLFHVALIALYICAAPAGADPVVWPVDPRITVVESLGPLESPKSSRPAQEGGGGGSATSPGATPPSGPVVPIVGHVPIPVQHDIDPDAPQFPAIDTLGNGPAVVPPGNGGGDSGKEGGPKGDSTKGTHAADSDDGDDGRAFDPDVILPQVDLAALQANVQYPRLAVINGIEGKVTVRAQIDERGTVIRTTIDYSDSKVLEEAARSAVSATTFEPATLDGRAVRSWVSVPVIFKLEE